MSKELDALPGLKEQELVRLGACAVCGKKLLEGGGVTFYRVKVERLGWMRPALERRVGLQMMLGGAGPLASVLGPDEDLAKVWAGPADVVIHEGCADQIAHISELIPKADDRSDEPK